MKRAPTTPRASRNAGKASPVLLGGVALLVLGGGYALWRSFGEPEPLALKVESRASQPASNPGVAAPKVISEKPGRPPIETDPNKSAGMLRLPQGGFVPPLNGVKNPPALQWKAKRPWSEIIGTKVVDYPGLGPVEWYVHADGSQSTTVMLPNTQNGKTVIEPMTLVGYAYEGHGVPELVTVDGRTISPGSGVGVIPGK